jgi:hypothetical protein
LVEARLSSAARGLGPHPAPVESDPALAREVLLPGLRGDHAAAGGLARDPAGLGQREIATVQTIAIDQATQAETLMMLAHQGVGLAGVRAMRIGDALSTINMRFTNPTSTMTYTLSSCHNAPGR